MFCTFIIDFLWQAFFENADRNRINELENAAKELKKCVPSSEFGYVDQQVEILQEAWKVKTSNINQLKHICTVASALTRSFLIE